MRRDKDHTPPYAPVKPAAPHNVAVAIKGQKDNEAKSPEVIASGKGKIAREIIDIAYENGIRVREDGPLAEILAQLDLGTPIPPEAIIAVAEILAKVYEADNALSYGERTNTAFSGLEEIL